MKMCGRIIIMKIDTYFLPSDIIPYKMPVPNTKPHPNILARPGLRKIGGTAILFPYK